MRLILKLPAHMTLEEVVDGITHAGWRVLTLPPDLHHLYPGYWVAARAIIADYLGRALVHDSVSENKVRHIELADDRDMDDFIAALSAEIMHRLEGAHCGTCGVDCQAPHLPHALHAALHVYAGNNEASSTEEQAQHKPSESGEAHHYGPG